MRAQDHAGRRPVTPRTLFKDPDKLSSYDVADLLGVKRNTFRAWIKRGKVKPPRATNGRYGWTREEAEGLRRYVR